MKHLKGKTVIFVTHALRFIDNCDRVAVIKDRNIVELGTV